MLKSITLANPFGPARSGREAVLGPLDYASSRMSDGKVLAFDELACSTSAELATILEVEHWRARIGDRASVEPFDLRVTTTFRRENGREEDRPPACRSNLHRRRFGPLRTS